MEGNPHYKIITYLLSDLENSGHGILDAGSGKTSLNILTNYFTKSVIDAVVFPGDLKKIDFIKETVTNENYVLKEIDLINTEIDKKYYLVLSHLLLGESKRFDHLFIDMLSELMYIKSTYFIIIDFLENPDIDFEYIEEFLSNNLLTIEKEVSVSLSTPQEFSDFEGKTLKGYLIKKSDE